MADKHPVLNNLNDMMRILRENGFKGEQFSMRAPPAFVDTMLDEMRSMGVDLGRPHIGDEVRLLFPSGEKILVEVSANVC